MTETTTEPTAETGFIEPVSMEDDPTELFAGDRGALDADVRRVLVRLLRGRFLSAERNPAEWRTLLEHQQSLESRLHDLFIRLVVDHERGIAFKRQVRSEELNVPILLKDEAYSRAETLVLIYLRTIFQRERVAGGSSVRVDVEELEQNVLTYFDLTAGNAAALKEVQRAITRLDKEGLIELESEGRYRVTPLVEIVLSAEKLGELKTWLQEQQARGESVPAATEDPGETREQDVADEADEEPAQ
ncbi:uncharacterized protein DUF4194 [Nocardioides albertanoniae]|uniref:Uncharacterized protein DUF4194 n=1 Tax=Nocardioides albertanoniae TaxID=1175486 RepID=A0A543A7W5_9ACTN|nr:DUF4194 domain-containing protein [Nocardioides albertanoniae]TQL68678.1 uncharacterized protein DUF4194 [Nocardioides albertanoniae]